MQVVVTNAVVSNTGDAAIFQGIMSSLVEAGVCSAADVTLLDSNAIRTRRLYPTWRIVQQLSTSHRSRITRLTHLRSRVRRVLARVLATGNKPLESALRLPLIRSSELAKAYRAIRDCDVVVSTGGTYLVDHYDFAFRAIELELAKRLGKKVLLWTQSAGPFLSTRAIDGAHRIQKSTDAAYFRDEVSRNSWVRINGNADTSFVAPDVVFALAPKNDGKAAAGERSKTLISVREWSHAGAKGGSFSEDRYQDSMREAARKAGRSSDVVALSTCQGVPLYVDDSAYATEIFKDQDVLVNRDFHRPDELLGELSQVSLVVTTRMHLAILSLIAGVPTIAIAYEFKTVELFNSLGLGRFVVSLEDVTPEWISAAITDATRNPGSARLSTEHLASVRAAAIRPAVALANS